MQIVAGLKIPSKLKFGDNQHIRLRKRIEHRLELIENGIQCPWCHTKMRCVSENFEHNQLKWECACGESFTTDCDGDDEDFID